MVSVENINHQGILEKNRINVWIRLEDWFSPKIRPSEPENIDYLKSFWTGTWIVEKLEKIREDQNVIYREIEENRRYKPELMHIDYKEGEITAIFDYYRYENSQGVVEQSRQLSIKIDNSEIGKTQFQISYQDSRRKEYNFEFVCQKPSEVLNKIDRAIMSRNEVERTRPCLIQTRKNIDSV
jgi:hypothetical protein